MRFAFTEDQEMFREAIAEMLTKECTHEAVEAAWSGETGRVPGLWDKLAEMGIVGLTVWGVAKRRWWGFVGAWFFVILGPSSSFAALVQRAQEHRMYAPLAAVIVLAVVGAWWLLRRIEGHGIRASCPPQSPCRHLP